MPASTRIGPTVCAPSRVPAFSVVDTRCSSPRRSAASCGRGGRGDGVGVPAERPVLLGLASELEAQRDHVLEQAAGRRAVGRRGAGGGRPAAGRAGEDEKSFTALHADAELDQLIYDGTSFSADEEDFIGLPGLLEPDQVRTLLSSRQKGGWPGRRPRSGARRLRPRRARPADGPRAAERAAQGAEHPRRPAQPPHEEAARDDPQRAPPGLRRPRRPWRTSSSSRSASPRCAPGAARLSAGSRRVLVGAQVRASRHVCRCETAVSALTNVPTRAGTRRRGADRPDGVGEHGGVETATGREPDPVPARRGVR